MYKILLLLLFLTTSLSAQLSSEAIIYHQVQDSTFRIVCSPPAGAELQQSLSLINRDQSLRITVFASEPLARLQAHQPAYSESIACLAGCVSSQGVVGSKRYLPVLYSCLRKCPLSSRTHLNSN